MQGLLNNYVSVLRNSLNFSGRAGRGEYWWFMAVNFVIGVALQIFAMITGVPLLSILFMLAMVLPGLSVSVRRLHDTDRSGWWLLVGLVPILGMFAVLAFMVIPGSDQTNRYGGVPSTLAPFAPMSPVPASR